MKNNIRISVITESKKEIARNQRDLTLYGYLQLVDRHTRGHSGFMLWIQKSISDKIGRYKFRKDRVIERRLKTQRGHLTALGVYAPTEGRDELNEELYETLQTVSVVKKTNQMLLNALLQL